MSHHDNVRRIIKGYEKLFDAFSLDARAVAYNWEDWNNAKPKSLSQDEWSEEISTSADLFLGQLLEEFEKMESDYIAEGKNSDDCNHLDPEEVKQAQSILNTPGSILDKALKIPPEYLECVLPIAFMRDLLRDKKMPFQRKYSVNFDEFYRRCGNSILAGA